MWLVSLFAKSLLCRLSLPQLITLTAVLRWEYSGWGQVLLRWFQSLGCQWCFPILWQSRTHSRRPSSSSEKQQLTIVVVVIYHSGYLKLFHKCYPPMDRKQWSWGYTPERREWWRLCWGSSALIHRSLELHGTERQGHMVKCSLWLCGCYN